MYTMIQASFINPDENRASGSKMNVLNSHSAQVCDSHTLTAAAALLCKWKETASGRLQQSGGEYQYKESQSRC